MTILDELLILLDDLGEAPAEAVRQYFDQSSRQIVFSSLGRLVNRGWVMKKSKRIDNYSITIHGVNELNRTLDAIKKEGIQTWDNCWRIVIFDIPESKRKMRDQFRLALRRQGYGLLNSSVWLTPWDRRENIKLIAKKLNLTSNMIQLETCEMTETYQNVLLTQKSWDWPALENAYRQFLAIAEKELASFVLGEPVTRFRAKKLVYLYAEVVKQDPLLPYDIAPNASFVRRAYDLYTKIRPFCLVELPSPEAEK